MSSPFKNRFRNFFLSKRISREAMKQLAGAHLDALEAAQQPTGAPDTAAMAQRLRPLYEQFAVGLGSGAATLAQRQGHTTTVGAAFEALRTYPAEAARKYILPAYEEGSAVYREFFPQGRTAFSGASQKTIGTAMRAFIATARKYEQQVGATVAARAQELLTAFEQADDAQGQTAKATKDDSTAIQADQRRLAVLLFAHYGTLLAAFAEDPAQAAAYFDFAPLPATRKARQKSGAA
ncbi:hypothetical protein [Hymenobacter weizhouensis]|uniref:hypothetical protein n=1 Tax=Hymenobacter sp. YIM 151500-1 TaxID=2987689 RepID=UPI002227525A|nr:hypothetical protein [Hymenobacter sp. YIM 151500-1]UYZ61964.1 hypothetical protein OIS53_13240 [Hymenobacter sp. YIM 151500-1]